MTADPPHPWQVLVRCACCGLRVPVQLDPTPTLVPPAPPSAPAAREPRVVFATATARRIGLLVWVSETCPRCHPPPRPASPAGIV